jgi:hypothetical protein
VVSEYLKMPDGRQCNITVSEARESFKDALKRMRAATKKVSGWSDAYKDYMFWAGMLENCGRGDVIKAVNFELDCESRGVFFEKRG